MLVKIRKHLVFAVALLSLVIAQNDGLVITKHPNGSTETEGRYTNGVREGNWTYWYEGEVFIDDGEDQEPNTGDEGEHNGIWDSTETVVIDLDGDTFYDPPQIKMEGSYINGNRDSTWTSWYANGNKKEELNYTLGKLNGSQIHWYENGNKKDEGNYVNGKQEGSWVWYYETGINKEQTYFLDGQQDGLWIEWHNDGAKKKERKFINGERDSIWTSWYPNGNKKLQSTYSKGKLNGPFTSWYENGIVKEQTGEYINNKLHNKWIYWADDGRKTEETNYDNGLKNGLQIKWNNENIKVIETEYIQNKPHGKWTFWYDNGTIQRYEEYNEGTKDGHWVWWRRDGLKDKEGHYKNDTKHGVWAQWNQFDGDKHHKKLEETFVNNEINGKIIEWYDNGEKSREGIFRRKETEGVWTYWEPDGRRWLKFDFGTGLERVGIADLEERDGIFYKVGEHTPYTGVVEENGGARGLLLLGRFSSGKRDGQWVQWHRNGLMEIDGQ